MERLFDDRPITEMYVGYGHNDLPKMSKKELEQELDKANREIEIINNEIDEADTYPSFILKERLLNEKNYKDEILKQLSICKNEEVEENCIDVMINNLHKQFKAGIITEEYHDKYVEKLAEKSRELDVLKILEQERMIKESKELEERKEKKINFKKFKRSLSNYLK